MLDRIIVSADDESYFIEYLPVVAKAWQKYFPEARLTLAFVTDTENSSLVQRAKSYADVYFFPKIAGVPVPNQSKLSRHFLASTFDSEVCMIEDLDTIPLQRKFFEDKLCSRKEKTLLCVGHEVYYNTPDNGKFPISTMTAEGSIFKQFLNPKNLSYEELMSHWQNMDIQDLKARITSDKSVFSDESLIRHFIDRWSLPKITKVPREANIREQWIDRSWWSINIQKLRNDEYITCNFLRPPSRYYTEMYEIFKHVYGFPPARDEVLLEKK